MPRTPAAECDLTESTNEDQNHCAASLLSLTVPASAELIAYYTFDGNNDSACLQNVAGASYDGSFDGTAATYESGSGVGGSGAYLFGGALGNTFTPITIGLNINPGSMQRVTFGGWFKPTSIRRAPRPHFA